MRSQTTGANIQERRERKGKGTEAAVITQSLKTVSVNR